MPKTYDVDYFIKKFEAIPEEKWGAQEYTDHKGRHCALGHCGANDLEGTSRSLEATILSNIISNNLNLHIIDINDFEETIEGNTPKERVLNALYKIREKINAKEKRN